MLAGRGYYSQDDDGGGGGDATRVCTRDKENIHIGSNVARIESEKMKLKKKKTRTYTRFMY